MAGGHSLLPSPLPKPVVHTAATEHPPDLSQSGETLHGLTRELGPLDHRPLNLGRGAHSCPVWKICFCSGKQSPLAGRGLMNSLHYGIDLVSPWGAVVAAQTILLLGSAKYEQLSPWSW